MRGLENFIPDPAQLLPAHLYRELLTGELTDTHKPVVIKTIGGIVTENDLQIATTYLQAEHNLLVSFTHCQLIIHNATFYCGTPPTNVILRGGDKVPDVGIMCIGYVGVLAEVGKYPVSLCLQYAINICEALVEVHHRMLVHRNINPTTIIIHENGEAHLDGFHLSYNSVTDSSFTVDTSSIANPDASLDSNKLVDNNFERGTACLKYISPEHTGRVNNKPDQRSDMYSFGIVLYEMLTGAAPFQYDDPLEMMHAHIARPPLPLPAHLSSLGELVHILLAKDPEQRYLTPIGLKADLIKCRDLLLKYDKITPFPLRKLDLIASPRLSGELLGRQNEVASITKALNKIHERSLVVFISGSAGVGKTALVNAVLKSIQEKGMYGMGKFDEYNTTTKFFGAITTSIKNLLSQSISRSSSDINEWKKKLLQVIAGCESIFLDMFPQMAMYVEAPVSTEQMFPSERKYRMHTMIADLITMLSTISPFTLFFDDLQWADAAALELMEVISNASEKNILIIGTYRELNPELESRVESIKSAKKDNCICINLQPFGENDVLDLLCESLQGDRDHLRDLAKVIHSKTMGNTLFVIQFLAILYRRALVRFDWESQMWVWDINKIEQIGYTDGLVNFFLNIFHDLQEESLNLLKFASLLGNKFSLSLVSHFSDKFNFPGVSAAINEATKNGFLVYLGRDEYSFIHDKIRQSAYELSSEYLKQQVYYDVGVYLLNSDSEDGAVTSLLYLRHVYPQLLSAAVTEEGIETLRKATSSALKAGMASKTASAYQSALEYLKLGCHMLQPKDWENDNIIAYTLTLSHAECLYLCNFRDEALKEFSKLLELPLSLHQKVRVYQTEMQVLSSSVNYSEGIKVGLACCALLGFEVRDVEKNIQICHKLIKATDLPSVFHMPPLTDTNLSLLMDVMGILIIVAFFGDKNLFLLVASEMVRITLSHGPSPSCPIGLVFFASYYGLAFSEPVKAYQLGKLAVDLHKLFPVNSVKCKAHFLFTFVNPWRMHFSDNFNYLRSALHTAQAVGDYLYKGYASGHIPNTMLWVGRNVQEILAESRILFKDFSKKKGGLSDVEILCNIAVGYASLLAGSTTSEKSFTTLDGTVDEDVYAVSKNNGLLVDNWYEGMKIESLYMFGYYNDAIDHIEHYLSIFGSLVGHPHEPRGIAYCILDLLATLPSNKRDSTSTTNSSPSSPPSLTTIIPPRDPPHQKRDQLLVKVSQLRKHLDVWVQHSQQNFLHFDLLINAEIARVQGNVQTALTLFDNAATQARNNKYFYIQALAHELAARCLEESGMTSFAEISVKKALEGYSSWGAVQKVKQLSRKYSHLLSTLNNSSTIVEHPVPPQSEGIPHTRTRELDMRTIIKANHVLSKEIALPQLLQKFVNIVLENVGAEQAAIILVDQNMSWRVASSWSVHDEHTNDGNMQTSMKVEGARKSIIDFVLHTRRPIVIDSFKTSDFYDLQLRMEIGSVLCVPIGLKGLVSGAVYLEHSVPKVLQEDRLELMSLLCTQLYISIDNAKLYNSIQSSEQRYKTLAEGLPIMAFSRNSVGDTFSNSKLLQFFGLASDRAEEVELEEVIARVHDDDVSVFLDAWNGAVYPTHSSTVEVEVRMRRASDDEYRWTLCHVTPSFDSQNRAEMLLGTWMDIQDLKDAQAEQLKKAEIEASEQKYRSLAEAIPQIVWTSPADGDVNYFNQQWYGFTGLTESESLGHAYIKAFHPQDMSMWPIHLEQADFEVKLRIRRKDGVYRWHLARAILVAGGKKFGTFTDIEDQVQTEISLKIARETADKAAHNQAAFVANMSHEIRTPMNGLLGMLYLLIETEMTEEQRDYADTMKRSANSLLQIIDDVLDFSKIQEGKLELRVDVINVESILEDVIGTLSILAAKTEMMLFVHRDVPAKLIGDSGKLRQVIMNLVGNSVKFTPSGQIFVSCVVDKWQGENVLLKFEVVDTGDGIGEEKQQGLFTPFYQANSWRSHGGTGLGLAICKQLVALFHGEISVKSKLGEGSTFTFTATFKIAPDQPQHPFSLFATSSQQWRVMLVSNLPRSLTILENHLQTCKIPFISTTSQDGAMEILQKEKEKRGDTRGINCVILDVFSPLQTEVDIQKLASPFSEKHTVLVVAPLQRLNLMQQFPHASFLIKPITFHKFIEALSNNVQPKEKLILNKFHYQGSSKVLIVEDNKVNQKVIASFLSKCNVSFAIANNGLEAFQMVNENPLGYFSLILLDLSMPIWDGFRACAEIRKLENGTFHHVIIALTANVVEGILDDCKAKGMDDVISKPIDFKQLIAVLSTYLQP